MTDLNYPIGGVMASFLGIPASCPPGPAKMALRFGTPIIPVVSLRTAIGESMIHLLPQVEVDDLKGEQSVQVLTERLNRAFEPWIINYAEQYYWIYPRWRVRPEGREWTLDQPTEEVSAERKNPPHSLPPRVRDLLHR
jgi:lauroyl/myristoyl acyltransferase